MAKEFEGYARECVVLARHAARVELRDQLIQLLRMMESSSEPRSRRNDERIQTSERALRLFGPIRDCLLRFNEALGEFGKIEVAGPYPSANTNMYRRPLRPPMVER